MVRVTEEMMETLEEADPLDLYALLAGVDTDEAAFRMLDERLSIKLRYDSGEDFIKFKYHLSPSVRARSRTVEHEIVGGDTITQLMGEKPTEIELSGHVTEREVKKLEREVKRDNVLNLITEVWEGEVIIESVRAEPISDTGGVHDGEWIYQATIVTREVLDSVTTA